MARNPCHKRIREQSAERYPEMAGCLSCHSNVLRTAITMFHVFQTLQKSEYNKEKGVKEMVSKKSTWKL